MSKDKTRLFEQFLIVSLRNDSSRETFVPYIKEVWPPSSTPTSNVALFCFPEDIDINAIMEIKKVSSFFFVLTDSDGKQQVGFTKRILSGTGLPQSICMLTHCAWARHFAHILDAVESRLRVSWSALQSFLATLYSTVIPAPGEKVIIATDPLFTFPRPADGSSFADVSLAPSLLSTFSSNSIIQLFASLLFERRIIVMSSQLEKIASCVQAAVAALYPFAWHHIFIPVLPKQLIDYCSAPMPFIVGLHKSLMLPLQKMPLNEVVFVDLDGDQVSSVPEDIANLPPTIIGPLRVVLEAATGDIRRTGSTDYTAVANAFRHFFVKIFAGYRRFFVNKDINGTPRMSFDKDAFIASPTQSKAVRKFLEVFFASQMFERFIAEREEQNISGTLFDKESEAYYLSQSGSNSLKTIAVERLSYYGQKYTTAVRNHLADSKTKLSSSSTFTSSISTSASSTSISAPPSIIPKPLPGIPSSHHILHKIPAKSLPPTPANKTQSVDRNKFLPMPPTSPANAYSAAIPPQPQPSTSFWNGFETPGPNETQLPSKQTQSPQPPLSSFHFSPPPPFRPRAATISSLPAFSTPQKNPPVGHSSPFNPFALSPLSETPNYSVHDSTTTGVYSMDKASNNPFFNPELTSQIPNPAQPDNIFTSFSLDMLAPTSDTQIMDSNPLFTPSNNVDDDFDSFLASRHHI
jgi:hypothetical protein